MLRVRIQYKMRLIAPLMLLTVLTACSGKEEGTTTTSGVAARAATAPAPPAVSAKVQSMGTEQLRDSASAALHENRMYAPAGDNAMEYYLALREKLPDDASAKSALTDLQPYTLIAAEQSLIREDFNEAQRLVALIEKVDENTPALPRLKQSIVSIRQSAERRSQNETDKVKRDAETHARKMQDQQRQAQQQASEDAAAAAQQINATQDAARRDNERQEAERQAAARREAEQRAAQQAVALQAAAAPAATTLRPVSTPAPRYPADALRAGMAGEVLVEITVGTDGSVTSARILRATPVRIFDREALSAVKRWRFEPISSEVTTRRTLSFAPNN